MFDLILEWLKSSGWVVSWISAELLQTTMSEMSLFSVQHHFCKVSFSLHLENITSGVCGLLGINTNRDWRRIPSWVSLSAIYSTSQTCCQSAWHVCVTCNAVTLCMVPVCVQCVWWLGRGGSSWTRLLAAARLNSWYTLYTATPAHHVREADIQEQDV